MRQDPNKPPLVHYTDLRDGRVELAGRPGFGSYRCVTGPAILLPRVGKITPTKVASLSPGLEIMLSDCVMALKPERHELVAALRQKLIANFAELRQQYTGTGAPFITLGRLKRALHPIGVSVED